MLKKYETTVVIGKVKLPKNSIFNIRIQQPGASNNKFTNFKFGQIDW